MAQCNPDQLKSVSHRRLDPPLLFPIIKDILCLIPYMLHLFGNAFEVEAAAFPENCEIFVSEKEGAVWHTFCSSLLGVMLHGPVTLSFSVSARVPLLAFFVMLGQGWDAGRGFQGWVFSLFMTLPTASLPSQRDMYFCFSGRNPCSQPEFGLKFLT